MRIFSRSKGKKHKFNDLSTSCGRQQFVMSVTVLYFTKHTNNTYIIVLIIHLIYEHVTNNYFLACNKTSHNQ